MSFVLTIAEGKGRGRQFRFDAARVTIGRGAENDVVLNDPGVSRTHARIERETSFWTLADNGSANGTELNGAALTEPKTLRSGDRIGVGGVSFQFDAGEDSAQTRISSRRRDSETRISALPAAQARAIDPRRGRQLRPSGLARLWARLPLDKRLAAALGAAALAAGAARPMVSSRGPRGLSCPETVAVEDDISGYSFGRGEVDVECGGKAVFGFNAPPETRVLFHYLPMRLGAPGELDLQLNGKHLAWAPGAGARGEPQVLALPPELLGKHGRNFISFIEGRGADWAIGKVRVELLAVTRGDLAAARQAYDRGRRKLEERRIAPRNLYDAWKAFAEARRQMEGLAEKPALYGEVAQLIKAAERDLEKECGRLLFSAARFERYGQEDKAQQTYREALLHFPGEEPASCRKKAQASLVSQPPEASEPP